MNETVRFNVTAFIDNHRSSLKTYFNLSYPID